MALIQFQIQRERNGFVPEELQVHWNLPIQLGHTVTCTFLADAAPQEFVVVGVRHVLSAPINHPALYITLSESSHGVH